MCPQPRCQSSRNIRIWPLAFIVKVWPFLFCRWMKGQSCHREREISQGQQQVSWSFGNTMSWWDILERERTSNATINFSHQQFSLYNYPNYEWGWGGMAMGKRLESREKLHTLAYHCHAWVQEPCQNWIPRWTKITWNKICLIYSQIKKTKSNGRRVGILSWTNHR